MADREDWGVRLLFGGMGLGFVLMLFAVTFQGTAFYQAWFAPTMLEAMKPLGYALDAGILLAFAMSVAGIACFSLTPSGTGMSPSENAPGPSRRESAHRARQRPRQPSSAHGST